LKARSGFGNLQTPNQKRIIFYSVCLPGNPPQEKRPAMLCLPAHPFTNSRSKENRNYALSIETGTGCRQKVLARLAG
jgi:hypothetical protein